MRVGPTCPRKGNRGFEDALAATSGIHEEAQVGVHEKDLGIRQFGSIDDLRDHAGHIIGAMSGSYEGLQLSLIEHMLQGHLNFRPEVIKIRLNSLKIQDNLYRVLQ